MAFERMSSVTSLRHVWLSSILMFLSFENSVGYDRVGPVELGCFESIIYDTGDKVLTFDKENLVSCFDLCHADNYTYAELAVGECICTNLRRGNTVEDRKNCRNESGGIKVLEGSGKRLIYALVPITTTLKADNESTEITMKVDNLRPDFYRDGTYSSTINITSLKTDGNDDRETLRSLSFKLELRNNVSTKFENCKSQSVQDCQNDCLNNNQCIGVAYIPNSNDSYYLEIYADIFTDRVCQSFMETSSNPGFITTELCLNVENDKWYKWQLEVFRGNYKETSSSDSKDYYGSPIYSYIKYIVTNRNISSSFFETNCSDSFHAMKSISCTLKNDFELYPPYEKEHPPNVFDIKISGDYQDYKEDVTNYKMGKSNNTVLRTFEFTFPRAGNYTLTVMAVERKCCEFENYRSRVVYQKTFEIKIETLKLVKLTTAGVPHSTSVGVPLEFQLLLKGAFRYFYIDFGDSVMEPQDSSKICVDKSRDFQTGQNLEVANTSESYDTSDWYIVYNSFVTESFYLSKIEFIANSPGEIQIKFVSYGANCNSKISCEDFMAISHSIPNISKIINLTVVEGYNSFDFVNDNLIEEYSFPAWNSTVGQLIQLEVSNESFDISDYIWPQRKPIGDKKRFAFKVSGKKALVEKKCSVKKTFDFIGENFQVAVSSINANERVNLFKISTLDAIRYPIKTLSCSGWDLIDISDQVRCTGQVIANFTHRVYYSYTKATDNSNISSGIVDYMKNYSYEFDLYRGSKPLTNTYWVNESDTRFEIRDSDNYLFSTEFMNKTVFKGFEVLSVFSEYLQVQIQVISLSACEGKPFCSDFVNNNVAPNATIWMEMVANLTRGLNILNFDIFETDAPKGSFIRLKIISMHPNKESVVIPISYTDGVPDQVYHRNEFMAMSKSNINATLCFRILTEKNHLYGTHYAYNINSPSQSRTRTNFSVYLENSDSSPPDSSLIFNKEYTFTQLHTLNITMNNEDIMACDGSKIHTLDALFYANTSDNEYHASKAVNKLSNKCQGSKECTVQNDLALHALDAIPNSSTNLKIIHECLRMPLQLHTYLGCFSENTTHRVMNNNQSLPNEVNITERCIEICSNKNFKYAGISNLICYCGENFYDKLPANTCECSVEHKSDYNSQSGGLNGLTSVYKLDYVDTCYQNIDNFLISQNSSGLIGLHQNCESLTVRKERILGCFSIDAERVKDFQFCRGISERMSECRKRCRKLRLKYASYLLRGDGNAEECHCDNDYKRITASLSSTSEECSQHNYEVAEFVYKFYVECPKTVFLNKNFTCEVKFFDLDSNLQEPINVTIDISSASKVYPEFILNSTGNTTFNISLAEKGFAEVLATESQFNSSSIDLVEARELVIIFKCEKNVTIVEKEVKCSLSVGIPPIDNEPLAIHLVSDYSSEKFTMTNNLYSQTFKKTFNKSGVIEFTASMAENPYYDPVPEQKFNISVFKCGQMNITCDKTRVYNVYKCRLDMENKSPLIPFRVDITSRFNETDTLIVENSTFTAEFYEFDAIFNEPGQYQLLANEYTFELNNFLNVTVEIKKDPNQVDFNEIRLLFAALANGPNATGDLIADIFKTKPKLVLNMMALPGQPGLTGCLSNCSNLGRCGLDDNNEFKCDCNEFYVGEDCATDTRACSSSPCKNNGTCFELDSENRNDSYAQPFRCECSSEIFYGKNCENKVNVCFNRTCSYNGRCFDNATVPTCRCFKHFSGANCEIKSEEMKAMKQKSALISYAAITIVVMFYGGIFLLDYFNLVHVHLMRILFH